VTLRPTDRPAAIACRDVRADTDDTRQSIDGSAESPASSGSPASPVPGADRFVAAVAVDGEVLFAGPSVPAVLGIERATLVGDDLLDYVHPNDREPVSDALSAVATNRVVTHRLRHANGGFVWVESVVDEELAPEFGGRVVGASRRRRADLPGGFREFLEYGTDLVTVVDADGRVRYESPAVEEVLGYEQGSTVGRSPLGYVHPDDRERVTERFYRALNDPDATPTMEYRYRTADGNWVWLESRSRSLPDDVAVGRLLINSRDVSERKARERRLTDRNERLDRFASIVSHDLRNPLSVIRGSMEMAELNGDTEPLGARRARRPDRPAGLGAVDARPAGLRDRRPSSRSVASLARRGTPPGARTRPSSSARMPECAATAAGCDRCSRTCSGTRRNTPRRTAQTRFDRPTAAKTPHSPSS